MNLNKARYKEYVGKFENESIDETMAFSLRKNSDIEEVYARAIYTVMQKVNVDKAKIIFSYLCERRKLTEEEIENLMYISSGAFNFKYWNDEVVAFVCNMIENHKEELAYPYLVKAMNNEFCSEGLKDFIRDLISHKRSKILNELKNKRRKIFGIIERSCGNEFLKPIIEESLKEVERAYDSNDFSIIKPIEFQKTTKTLGVQLDLWNYWLNLMVTPKIKICDRLNWKELLRMQTFSDEFKQKYKSLFTEALNENLKKEMEYANTVM